MQSISVFDAEFLPRTVGSTHEQREQRWCMVLDTNTAVRLVIPRTELQPGRPHVDAMSVPLIKDKEMCCLKEYCLIVPYICPLPATGNPRQRRKCGNGSIPQIKKTSFDKVIAGLRELFSIGVNYKNWQLAILDVHFLPDCWITCCVLASLPNGVLVVVPLDVVGNPGEEDFFPVWEKVQHIDGEFAKYGVGEDAEPRRLPGAILNEAHLKFNLGYSSFIKIQDTNY